MAKVLDEAKPYVITGIAKDNAWIVKNRNNIESYIHDDMRQNGWIPILDSSSGLNISFDPEAENFSYKITMFGYKVGDKAQDYLGVLAEHGLLLSQDMKQVSILDLNES